MLKYIEKIYYRSPGRHLKSNARGADKRRKLNPSPVQDRAGGTTDNQDKIVKNTRLDAAIPQCRLKNDPAERARKIAELKRKVDSGSYLIKQYDIIEGLLNSMSKTLE